MIVMIVMIVVLQIDEQGEGKRGRGEENREEDNVAKTLFLRCFLNCPFGMDN